MKTFTTPPTFEVFDPIAQYSAKAIERQSVFPSTKKPPVMSGFSRKLPARYALEVNQ